jgi:hypothetical protein
MGAHYFATAAWGKTPQAAFQAAQERARWEHGHGGYTGTIAEKHDFALFTVPPRMTARKFEMLVSEAAESADVEDARDDLRIAEAWLRSKPKGQVRVAQRRVREWQARVRQYERDEAKLTRKLGAHAYLIRQVAEVAHGDKWGPAAAVEVTSPAERKTLAPYWQEGTRKRGDRLFLFFGMASS